MKNYPPANEIETISECLEILTDIDTEIESIKMQLEFPRDDNNVWRQRATYAMRSLKKIRIGVTGRLSVLRQQEKERNIQLHQRHNDFLVNELARYVPDVVLRVCDYRARIKAENAV